VWRICRRRPEGLGGEKVEELESYELLVPGGGKGDETLPSITLDRKGGVLYSFHEGGRASICKPGGGEKGGALSST